MRPIDADAFLETSIEERRFVIFMEDAINAQLVVKTVYKDLAEALNNAPTLDVVAVTRCKDCKHSAIDACSNRRMCVRNGEIKPNGHIWFGTAVQDDHFCGYAERMEEEEQL